MPSVEQKITDTIEDLKAKSRQIFEEKLVQYENQMREHLHKREVDSKGYIVTPFFNFQFKVENTYTVAPATCSCSICSANIVGALTTDTSNAAPAPTLRRSSRIAAKPKPDYKEVEQEEKKPHLKVKAKKAVISEREIEEKLIHVEPPASLHQLRKIFIDATTKTYIEKGGWTEENIVQMESKRADYYAALKIYQDRLNAVSSVPLSKGWVKEIERWHRIRIASKVQDTVAAPRRSSRLAAKPKPDYKEVEETKEKKRPLKVKAKKAVISEQERRRREIEEKLIHVEIPASLHYIEKVYMDAAKGLLKNKTQEYKKSFKLIKADYFNVMRQYQERLQAVASFPVGYGTVHQLVKRHREQLKS